MPFHTTPSGSHAPAWEQVPTLQRRIDVRAAGAARAAFPRGAWEREAPGRYVGAAAVEEDGTPFMERFAALQETLAGQFDEPELLTALIREKLAGVVIDG